MNTRQLYLMCMQDLVFKKEKGPKTGPFYLENLFEQII